MKHPAISQQREISDEEWFDHVDAKLANFGDRIGKHGPLSAVRRPTMIRLRTETDAAILNLSRAMGSPKSALIAQLCEMAAECPPRSWHRAIWAFQVAARGRGRLDEVAVG